MGEDAGSSSPRRPLDVLETVELAGQPVPAAGVVTVAASELERVELLTSASATQRVLFLLGCVLTGGVLALLVSWRPRWRARLLRTRVDDVTRAQSVLVVICTAASPSNKSNTTGTRSYEECRLHCPLERAAWFELRHSRYVFDAQAEASQHFVRLENALNESLAAARNRCLDDLGAGGGWSNAQVQALRDLHGPNELALGTPSWPRVLLRKVAHPFYIFQALSAVVWFSEGYVTYAVVVCTLSIFSIAWEVREQVVNAQRLHARLAHAEHSVAGGVRVVRDAREVRVSPAELVVGDVVVVDEGVVPADLALLSGHCMADEATLTGEAVPVTKQALVVRSTDLMVDAKLKRTHRESVLFAGSTVLETADKVTCGVVLGAGFSTTKGELFRAILFPQPLGLQRRLESDSYRFLGALSLLALLVFIRRLRQAAGDDGVELTDALVSALDLVTIAVPPALPVVLTAGVGFALSRLERDHDVACIDAARVNVAGHVDCFCFDKTGTLSSDHLDFHGFDECSTNGPGTLKQQQRDAPAFLGLQREVEVLSLTTIVGLATCHGLSERAGQVQGYALERTMFQASGYSLEPEGDAPENFTALVASPIGKAFGLVTRFPFDAARQRSSVVVEDLESGERVIYAKGSPEALRSICAAHTLPPNYIARARSYAHQGFYVVGLAAKPFGSSRASENTESVTRETVESELGFLGFLLFVNQVKPESGYVVGTLEDAGVDVRILTGDDALTAVHVARKINMELQSAVLLVDVQQQQSESSGGSESIVVYADVDELAQNVDDSASHTAANGSDDMWTPVDSHTFVGLTEGSSLAITGAALEQLLASTVEEEGDADSVATAKTFVEELVGRAKVFARVRPQQKTWVVETLMTRHDACVAMCGDGANDCGALKAAHVGLALSGGDAALVAPFASRSLRVADALELLREGRGALSAAFVAFRYMVLYSVVQVTLSATMNDAHSQMSDAQFLFDDLVVVFALSLLMVRTPAAAQLGSAGSGPSRSVRAPPKTLFAAELLLSLAGQLAIFFCCVSAALAAARAQSWFCSAEQAFELTQAAVAEGDGIVAAPCYVFTSGEPADLTSRSFENSVLWRFGHLQYWIAALTLNLRDVFRAPLVRGNRSFALYLALLLLLLLAQLLGDQDDQEEGHERASVALAAALRSGSAGLSLGARALPVSFAWTLFLLFGLDVACVVVWELVLVGALLPRCQQQRRGFRRSKNRQYDRGWRVLMCGLWLGGGDKSDKQSLVTPYASEASSLRHNAKPTGVGKVTTTTKQSLKTAGSQGVLLESDDEELDVLDMTRQTPHIV